MKIILIGLFLLSNINSFAWEWNDKAFKKSINQYKQKLDTWSQNPGQVINDFKQKYNPSLNLIKNEILDFKTSTDWDNIKKYHQIFDQYTNLSSDDLFRRFYQDINKTFQWTYYHIDSVPIIGPYKREFQSKIDTVRFQIVPYRSLMQSQIKHSF